ncbi:MAG: hypothetical protein KGL43_10475 [Burkholderiales bacterium]|nr:hypothetical protein [Burkholderiales bacterium]MDE2394214.1 hypothetical protein [Burkholderiales bacterium]MDE2454009.1 hypothetical protein [Burkholderiales bacterium]
MLTIRTSQMQALGDTAPNQPVVQPCSAADPHWIEFELVDPDGNPVPGEPYRIRLPDQSLRIGTTDANGKVRFEPIVAGQATICYTGFDTQEWQAA